MSTIRAEVEDRRTLYTLSHPSGASVQLSTYGASIVSIRVPSKSGEIGEVTLGFATDAEWRTKNTAYLGATIGRYGNRIANGKFELDGATYTLAQNNGANSLHGGIKGFDKVDWVGRIDEDKVVFAYTSPAGEEGFPGTVTAEVAFSLSSELELTIVYTATTDAPTVLNLTNHTYFNLAGPGANNVLGHVVHAPIEQYVPVNAALIPTGEIASVAGTPFDFREATAIGARVAQVDNGYDHNLLVNRDPASDHLEYALQVSEPTSGRTLQVFTTEPGIQLYVGGFLDGSMIGREGLGYGQFGGLCVETQHYPDSPNQPLFPSAVLRPDQSYSSTTVYKFATE
eukprot:m.183449 g.183449  ORF g.183449 m.183449 type:complete len:341 (+) comp53498_c0_seq2:2-1024(+)